jgi:ribosomal protein L28
LRRWNPNVINKRVWSDALDDWVQFKMTTRALKEIDNVGGIDNYLLALDNNSAAASNYVTKMRGLVAGTLYSKGALPEKTIKKLGYHKNPPDLSKLQAVKAAGEKESEHLV